MEKVVVITGASDGMGKAIAKDLSKDNKVIILSNIMEKNNLTLEEYLNR